MAEKFNTNMQSLELIEEDSNFTLYTSEDKELVRANTDDSLATADSNDNGIKNAWGGENVKNDAKLNMKVGINMGDEHKEKWDIDLEPEQTAAKKKKQTVKIDAVTNKQLESLKKTNFKAAPNPDLDHLFESDDVNDSAIPVFNNVISKKSKKDDIPTSVEQEDVEKIEKEIKKSETKNKTEKRKNTSNKQGSKKRKIEKSKSEEKQENIEINKRSDSSDKQFDDNCNESKESDSNSNSGSVGFVTTTNLVKARASPRERVEWTPTEMMALETVYEETGGDWNTIWENHRENFNSCRRKVDLMLKWNLMQKKSSYYTCEKKEWVLLNKKKKATKDELGEDMFLVEKYPYDAAKRFAKRLMAATGNQIIFSVANKQNLDEVHTYSAEYEGGKIKVKKMKKLGSKTKRTR